MSDVHLEKTLRELFLGVKFSSKDLKEFALAPPELQNVRRTPGENVSFVKFTVAHQEL